MVNSNSQPKSKSCRNGQPNHKRNKASQSKRIALMGRNSINIVNELYSPIDAINRFINLALQSLEEGSQSRQFLIESKKGVRKTALLLKKLNNYVKRIEEEVCRMEMEVVNE